MMTLVAEGKLDFVTVVVLSVTFDDDIITCMNIVSYWGVTDYWYQET